MKMTARSKLRAGPSVRCVKCRETSHWTCGLADGDPCASAGCGGRVAVSEQFYRPPGFKKPILVDIELDLKALDIINSLPLPGLKVNGTCAGHLPACDRHWNPPRPWIEFSAPLEHLHEYAIVLMTLGNHDDAIDFRGWRVGLNGRSVHRFWFILEPGLTLSGGLEDAALWWQQTTTLLREAAGEIRHLLSLRI